MEEIFLPELTGPAYEIIGEMPDGIELEDLCKYAEKNKETKKAVLVHLLAEIEMLQNAIISLELGVPYQDATRMFGRNSSIRRTGD